MKLKLRKAAALFAAALALGGGSVGSCTAFADGTTDDSSSTHTLNSSYVVYGAGTSSEVRSRLDSVFQADSSFKNLTATAADYAKYITQSDSSSTTDAAMISSVAIAPGDPGSGVKVNIKNYDGENNITKVTSQQYAMVAQMAGVTDVSIVVTANRPVSGESALTGVYKALATDGVSLNTQNTATANQMLEATQPAIDANKDDSSYPGKLMAAIGDVSKQLAQMRQDNQNLATKQDIQDMLNKALAKQGIEDKTSSGNVTQITNALFNFQNSPISSSKSYIKNVDNTIDNVKNSVGNLMNKAKNWANSESGKKTASEAKNLWQRFVSWIRSLFN